MNRSDGHKTTKKIKIALPRNESRELYNLGFPSRNNINVEYSANKTFPKSVDIVTI